MEDSCAGGEVTPLESQDLGFQSSLCHRPGGKLTARVPPAEPTSAPWRRRGTLHPLEPSLALSLLGTGPTSAPRRSSGSRASWPPVLRALSAGCGLGPSLGLPCTESLFVLKPCSGHVSWPSLGASHLHIHTHSLFLIHTALTGPHREPRSISNVTHKARLIAL